MTSTSFWEYHRRLWPFVGVNVCLFFFFFFCLLYRLGADFRSVTCNQSNGSVCQNNQLRRIPNIDAFLSFPVLET